MLHARRSTWRRIALNGMEENPMRAKYGSVLLSAATLCIAAAALPAAGDDNVNHDRLMHDVQAARTRADHEEIALSYEKQASADLAAAEEHRRMGSQYRKFAPSGVDPSTFASMAIHCNNLVELYTSAAKEHSALAALHREATR
jgi:hypothetical protein